MDGEDNATAWITFEPLPKADSLEFVAGSHLGPMYNTSAFDPKDETRPHDPSLPLPNLPPIDAEREKWKPISWAVEPGDVVFFHFKTLHGGAPTHAGQRRRTLTLRFFGERTHYDPKTAKALPNFPDMATKLKPGDTMRAPGFLQLYPKARTPEGGEIRIGPTDRAEP
jgi:ectoine hydroxylase-related dioxygenase (phytanoyl-CoA dioxygenase family)